MKTALAAAALAATALTACASTHDNSTTTGQAAPAATAAPRHAAPTKRSGKVTRRILAIDATASTANRARDAVTDLHREIAESYGALGGAGTYLTIVSFAGGPGDTTSIDDLELCTGGSRRCSDPAAQAPRIDAAIQRTDTLLATQPTTGGSDPIGFLYQLLSTARNGYEDNPIHITVWTDLASNSDTLTLDGTTDISTPERRAQVINTLAAKGLDFHTLDLTNITIDIRLVLTDIAAQSTAYANHLKALAEQLLARTDATTTVTYLTTTNH